MEVKVNGKEIRVLNILHDERIGGPQIRVLSVAKRLRQHNIDTVIVVPKGDDIFAQMARKEGLNVYQTISRMGDPNCISGIVRSIIYLLSVPFAVFSLLKIIKKEKINIIHNNTAFNIVGFIAALCSNTKLVWHLNDTLAPKIVKKILNPVILSYADVIAVSSKAVARYYFNTIHAKRLSVIYPPIDIEKFRSRSKNKKGDLVIGMVANINPYKGLEYFINAADLIRRYNSEKAKFVIVGKIIETQRAYYNKILELQKKLKLDSDLTFMGYRSDISEILSSLDVFILSSVSEGCPIALLEAMASGLPSVAADVGGVQEIIVGNTGLIVPPKNPEAIADAVSYLLANPKEKLKLARRGRKRVERVFSLGNCVERHRRVYNKCSNR